MGVFKQVAALSCAAVLALGCLSACGESKSANAASASEDAAEEVSGQETSREEVEAIIDAAVSDYQSLGFSSKTETTATATVNGQTQQQVIESSMVGEIDKASENPRMHMACSSRSNTQLGITEYDMYVDKSNLFVTQRDQLYRDELPAEAIDSYALSVTSITSKEQIGQLLDVASSCKVGEEDGDTVISITADPQKLTESGLFDESSLPEGSSVATLVASYTIDSDNHFKTARLMSSTTGTPTYRVTQTYRYYDYDQAQMPEWPDWQAYVAKQSGIMTDSSGRMYLVGDDGQVYYIESINPDGTINFDTSSISTSSSTDESGYVYYNDGGSGTTTTSTTVSSNDGTAQTNSSDANGADKGRAYITAYDGTIHYLDEEGSQIMDLGGSLVFVDANGEWYFLNVEDGEDLSAYR